MARLDANSHHSSRPPSTNPPHVKRQPPRHTSKRKRGGRPGLKRAIRPMVVAERLAQVGDRVPTTCPCGATLTGTDPAPRPHQVAEPPEVQPEVVEHRFHRLTCPRCNRDTRAAPPPGIPAGASWRPSA